ncbi:MAG: recombinase family protein [Eubacterium sp.]
MKVIQDSGKKVVALYRVSTKGQVDKNGIPLQEESCRKFAKSMNWEIVKEYYEKGVSGFKKRAGERDQVQKIMQEVREKKYNILLLFMYDRLGRLGDDTLDLARWFLNHEIEIWTVRDGQIRNDNIGDKIINLIRFNAAQEESEKSAFRISNRMRQLTEAGCYIGGPVPYGYKKVRKGRLDKKGREIYDLEIDEAESKIAQEIFKLYVYKGKGTEKIAQYLNEKGLRSNGGRLFRCNSINRILSNHLMIGYYKRQDVISIYLPELQIIEDGLFRKAQTIRLERSKKRDKDRLNAMSSKQETLLSGNLFCGDCGCRMGVFTRHKWYRKNDGTIRDYSYADYYHCLKKRQYKTCKGQTTYYVQKVDSKIRVFLNIVFEKVKYNNRHIIIEKESANYIKSLQSRCNSQKERLTNGKKDLKQLHLTIASTLEGNSVFTEKELKQAIVDQKELIDECRQAILEMEEEMSRAQDIRQNVKKRYAELCDWALRFESMDTDEKRYVVNQLLYKVRLYRGYEIEIEPNVGYKCFFDHMEHIKNI